MKNKSSPLGLMEEREEFMVFPSEKDRTLMKTQFLKPFVTSIDGSVAELPRRRHLSLSSDLKDSVSFCGFWFANRHLVSWLRKMEALHEPTWRKAGIFEAIKASTYNIFKNQSLILSVAENWCSKTKSFVFPWGEATVTLEDVTVLLGFSVLGSSVFAPLERSEMRDSVKRLEKVWKKNKNRADCRVSKEKWISSFRDRGGQIEHEAFLALWLSDFVFPDKSRRSVSRNVFPIAVRLARGEKIALAPAVLAGIYRDLGRIRVFARDKYLTESLNLKSLFKLVQVWTWERFKNLRPEAKEIPKGEPRISRWRSLQQKSDNVRMRFVDFDWRPYTKPLKNWNPLKFYVEEAMWVTLDDSLDDEFVAFARCVRSSPLVGIGFVENYYPNRVAKQFGLAQDVPGLVTHRSNFTEKKAWNEFSKSIDGLRLYMPSRLAKASVTARYRDWWMKSVSKFLGFEETTETFYASKTVDDDQDVNLKVLSLCQVLQKLGDGFPTKLKRCRTRRVARNLRSEVKKGKIGDYCGSAYTDMPLSHLFHKGLVKSTMRNKRCKRGREKARSSMDYEDEEDDDNITIAQRMRSREKHKGNVCESLVKRSRLEEKDNNDSRSCQKLASAEGESVAPQETDQKSKEDDEEEIRSKTGNKLSYFPHVDSNENDDDDDDDDDDVDYEELKRRKLGIEELILELEASVMEAKMNVEKIKNLKTRRNPIRSGDLA